ncbi:solute carrier family 39 (zinc transporter), member 1/2/3 [Nematocida minor]|uniref:solute carrier family 39 (zinc transporter), member 1/2/3 n=1 Tax=Nematocida minor TaxID=1912983 RepID=UPI00221EC6BA|nr:solute carrier family 39 (zinc transporter), member 1/2/3 [Nematocida minor]KAI5190950.1 solute carrier family 39 (zinc transporter), member 1/2/3 [Nematocida minor]
MNDTNIVATSAVVLFVFTLLFSYAYNVIKPYMKGYTYIKCLTGGFIIGIILIEVLPDIYDSNSSIPVVTTGLSFFLLFAISKLYIERVEAKEQDSIPEGAGKKEALIFILALSLHSFMEGLGISSKKGPKLLWYIISILVHKWLEAIVLGTSVLTSELSRPVCFSLILIYSSLTSIGSLLGHWLSFTNSENSIITLILNGIAAGSFFYIGFVEMVGNEFETSSGKLTRRKTFKKITSMFIGYSFITSVILAAHSIEKYGA